MTAGNTTRATPKVTIIIPAFNMERFIPAAIESALRQTYGNIEILVVDDGSTDGTVAACRNPHVRVIRQSNQGPAAARNRGAAESDGPLVSFLDADDQWHPRMVESQVDAMLAESDVGLVYTNVWHLEGSFIRPLLRSAQRAAWSGDVFDVLLKDNFLITPTVMVRRSCFEEVNGFDEHLRMSEDYDLWLRLARICRFRFIDRPLGRYRLNPSGAFQDLAVRYAARQRIMEKLLSDGGRAPDHAAQDEFFYRSELQVGLRYLDRRLPDEAWTYLRRAAGRRWWILRNWLLVLTASRWGRPLRRMRGTPRWPWGGSRCHDVFFDAGER